jgi:Fe-S cluster assembly protein SufD
MIELAERQDLRVAGEPAWLAAVRRTAMDRFEALGFPTTKQEDWRFTSVSAIARAEFEAGRQTQVDLTDWPLAGLDCSARLVFVNGHLSERLTAANDLPAGVRVSQGPLEAHFARYAAFDQQPFVAQNTALFADTALVEIAEGVALEKPVHLVFISAPDGRPTVSYPRTLILAGRGSQSAVVETYLGPEGSAYFTNAVTEIVAAEQSVFDHYRLQFEGRQAYHVATVEAVQRRSSVFHSHNVSFGAALARNDINCVLVAEGAECFLNGLYVTSGNQHVDNHTLLDHAQPNSASRELYKGILSGHGTGVFNGKIIVRKDAQKTNAIQSNKNLLLSGDAVINTKPQLEIFADDVRCTHGATVGQLDGEALFYMRSRGVPAVQARELLTYAFAAELLDRMRWQPIREKLTRELSAALSANRDGGAE